MVPTHFYGCNTNLIRKICKSAHALQEFYTLQQIYEHFFVLQILTKDSVTVYVNAIMYYKVKDATSAVANVDDYSGSARLLAATTLRNVLGTKNLGDILSERESIAQEMKVSFKIL